jgi:signal transduction histidine kinase
MFRGLYAKLVGALSLAFFALGLGFVAATEPMPDGPRLVELVAKLAMGAVLFSLVAALLIFILLTRRLQALAVAVNRFREGDFSRPMRLESADPAGDDIDRLSAAVQEMSERIAMQLERLQSAEASRRELLANVSHDLRTPLASMQGYLEILLLKQGTLPPEQERSYLEIATRHGERLGKLVHDLFQLTKLAAHEIRPQFEPFPVTELVQDVVQKFQLAAGRRGVRLDSRLTGEQAAVDADIALVETVLENLIENALRHTPRGGNVRVEVEPQSGRVALRVVDTGRGIADEDLPNLFERYYHVDRGETGDAAGTGLGLAIVRHIVELHGGAIRVESRLGQGTTFRFDLPAAADDRTPAGPDASAPVAPG